MKIILAPSLASGLLLLSVLGPSSAAQAMPAFPGAEGMAGAIEGGRGGQVLKVTTLAADGPGSLQAALDVEGPRVIVFDVSGVIEADELIITHGQVTIAGESAPGAGITIDGRLSAAYEFGTDDIIVRHIRVRPTAPMGPGEQLDAMQFSRASRVLLDHVSASFGVDETIDLYESQDVTVQWSTIESSATVGHPEGAHNYGLIQGPDGARASIHHNLFVHQQNRNPALATGPSEVRNNVVYNVRHGFVHHNAAAERFSIVGNSYLAGGDDDLFPFFFDDEAGGSDPDLSYYLADNYIDDPGVFTGVVDDPWIEPFVHPSFEYLGLDDSYRSEVEFDFGALVPDGIPVTQQSAAEAMPEVLDCAGAWPRDVVTLRSVQDTIDRTGSWGANVPPDLMEGLTPAEPLPDGDDDGMPDAWETEHGLDPSDGSDHAVVMPSGYTAIETYLHQRAAELVGDACPSFDDGGGDGGTGTGTETETGDEPGADSTGAGASGAGEADAGATGSGTGGTGGSQTGAAMDDGGEGGCGCRHVSSRGSALAWAGLLGLLGLRRRRRWSL